MENNPLTQLESFGQAVWLDFIQRDLINSGELRRLIDDDGLRGLTSNPAIFEKAIAHSTDYDEDIRSLARMGKSPEVIYEILSREDVQLAADEFRPIYERTRGADGYVSYEVNPHFARDTAATIADARRIWDSLNRPNIFIKVPATTEGIPAIKQLISEGINVNVTLLFGIPRYRQVAEAYISGLEARASKGLPFRNTASVCSFFLSRIDTLIDPMLEKMAAQGGERGALAGKIIGEIGIASAKIAYQTFKEIFRAEAFQKLATLGARPQRLLWASTGTKNPNYGDVKYIEPLIGPDTVNTMPMETLRAFRDHGRPLSRLNDGLDIARQAMETLRKVGIDIDKLTQQLEDEGIVKFCNPYDSLIDFLKNRINEGAEDQYSPRAV